MIGPGTLVALNHPYAERLEEIEESLKWLETIPVPEADSLVVVNIPSFQLYAWTAADRGKKASLTMPVVVGKAATSRTPILGGEISHLVFRPYWYVPRSIVVKEMLPAYEKNPAYFESHQLELTATNDDSKPGVPDDARERRAAPRREARRPPEAGAAQLAREGEVHLPELRVGLPSRHAGEVALRARPARLLARLRARLRPAHARRVPPEDRRRGGTAAAIAAAMEAERPKVVLLKPRVPVWLIYTTAIASADGRLAFFEDVYRRAPPQAVRERRRRVSRRSTSS